MFCTEKAKSSFTPSGALSANIQNFCINVMFAAASGVFCANNETSKGYFKFFFCLKMKKDYSVLLVLNIYLFQHSFFFFSCVSH